jgi:hypothetical protein
MLSQSVLRLILHSEQLQIGVGFSFEQMTSHLDQIKTIIEIIVGSLTIVGVIWKVILPLFRWLFVRRVVYAAKVAELQPQRNVMIVGALDKYVPIPSVFYYSDASIARPNWPSKANDDSEAFYKFMRETLSDLALKEAREWERTLPDGLSLLGVDSPELRLLQTYTRLRWFLIERCGSAFEAVSSRIGANCSSAMKSLEAERQRVLDAMPTRILILRIKNRMASDTKDLRLEITVGGSIYDVSVNERINPQILEKSRNRLYIQLTTLQPGYVVEVKIWYRWKAVAFGCRSFAQSEYFPGPEGIMINYIGVSNGKVVQEKGLLKDLKAWKSIELAIGRDPEAPADV